MQKRIISTSTRKFYTTARQTKPFRLIQFLHGYIYARWPYLYIGIGKGDHPISKFFSPILAFFSNLFPKKTNPSRTHSIDIPSHTIADSYHGKAIPLQTAKELVMIKQQIKQPDLEHVIPYVTARAIILENPDHIVALDCPCRVAKENPCTPIDVCLIVGEPFASFIQEHQPQKSRKISQDEAVRILEEEDARGHVHHAFFKDAMLGRYYAICNCCSCCCGAMKAHQNNIPMLASSGYIAVVDDEICQNCGICHEFCQFSALGFDENYYTVVNYDLCMGCGVCVSKCPEDAIHLSLEPSKGIPLEVGNLV